MRQTELTGKVQTVLGPIDADQLGVTLTHEHLLWPGTILFSLGEPDMTIEAERRMANEPVTLENLCFVHTHFLRHVDDSRTLDEETVIEECLLYKKAGGVTIVDQNTIDMRMMWSKFHHKPVREQTLELQRIARATGLNIVTATGYYVGPQHPPELATKTEEEITEEFVRDITIGIEDTGVRAGVIGEIGCSIPFIEGEQKVLRAAVAAQRQTGVPLNIHPSLTDELILENLKVLIDAGADLSRTVIDHITRWGYSPSVIQKLVDAGCFIEVDGWGYDAQPMAFIELVADPEFIPPDWLTDMQIVDLLIQLLNEGYEDYIVLGHDLAYRHMFVTYGGYGWGHVLRDIMPVLKVKGVSDEQIHKMLVENPKRAMQFGPVRE